MIDHLELTEIVLLGKAYILTMPFIGLYAAKNAESRRKDA